MKAGVLPFVAAVALAATAACAPPAEREAPPGRAREAILGGRASGDDEDANVFVTTASAVPTYCSGRLVAPGLVLTARHCTLKTLSGPPCNADGSLVDPDHPPDLTPAPASQITVGIGAQKSALRSVAVRSIVTTLAASVCRVDVAFLVLAEAGLDARTPLRRQPVRLGETFATSGWGYTSDGTTHLPAARSTLDALPITEVGPGAIPPGMFATAGNTLCFGDSGSAALVGGSLVGVYARIESPHGCAFAGARNVFTGIADEDAFIAAGYAAIGEEPWYEGAPPPWLAKSGAACASDAECRSNLCTAGHCSDACGDAGLACAANQVCTGGTCAVPVAADAGTMPSDAGVAPSADGATPPARSASCAITPGSAPGPWIVLAGAALLARARRARRTA